MLDSIQESATKFVTDNAATILTVGGVSGTVATGVLAWRGGFKAGRQHHADEAVRLETAQDVEADLPVVPTKLQQVVDYGPHAIPAAVFGGLTIASIIFSHRMTAQKTAALVAAYGLSQKQLDEYKEKVSEKLTGPKKQAIDDELAQDRVNNSGGANQVIVVEGKVLCFDSATGRYFQSSMEDIKRAEISTNQEILHHDVASASFFYEQLGLPPTTWSEDVGWNTDNLIEINYSTVLAYNDQPCLAIDFKYLPRPDYLRQYGS